MKVVIPANLTKEQKRAIQIEVDKTFREGLLQHSDKMDAMVLWILYDKYGWSKEQLTDFYNEYGKYYRELIEYYDLPDSFEFIAERNLKEYVGIDVDEWNKEIIKGIV